MEIDIQVTEVLSRVVSVNADSTEEAIQMVEDMYKQEEIVLDYADFDGNVIIEEITNDFKSLI